MTDYELVAFQAQEMAKEQAARAEAAEASLEEYRMRLAGALTALDGGAVYPSDPAMLPYLRSCPTIAAAIRERKGREAAEAKLAAAEASALEAKLAAAEASARNWERDYWTACVDRDAAEAYVEHLEEVLSKPCYWCGGHLTLDFTKRPWCPTCVPEGPRGVKP